MKKKKQMRENVISVILASSIVVSSFFNFGKLKKNKEFSKATTSKESVSNYQESNVKETTYMESTNSTIGTATYEVGTTPTYNDIVEDLVNDNNMNIISNKKTSYYFDELDNVRSIYNFDLPEDIVPEVISNETICTTKYEVNRRDVRDLYDNMVVLMNKIKDNSNVYLGEHPEFVSAFFTDKKSEYRIDQIAINFILRDCISNILETGTNKDICLLNDLRVVVSYGNFGSNNLATYSNENNVMVIYPDNIRNVSGNMGNDYWRFLTYCVQRELNEVRKQFCDCQIYGDSFPYQTIREMAGASELYNLGKSNVLVNNIGTRNEALIMALGLVNSNVNINDYYNAIFSNDIRALYDFCGVSSDEDIYSLNRVLYTMDIINNRFLNENAYEELGFDYRVDIFKMVINNLMNYTMEHKDFKLQDNLILFNIVKNLVLADACIDSNSLNEDEFSNIIKLNDIYIEFLSKHYKTTINGIREMELDSKIYNYVLATIDVCHRANDINKVDTNYIMYSSNLVKRFPLLKEILAVHNFMPFDYREVTDNYGYNALVKQKTN